MGILQRKFREYMNKEVIVVMTDGMAFRGRLMEFDDTALVLKGVLESTTTSVKWKPPIVSVPEDRLARKGDLDAGISYGEMSKYIAKLDEVVIKIDGILRVWKWEPEIYGPEEVEGLDYKKI